MKSYCTMLYMQRAIIRALPRDELEKKYIVEACLKEATTMLSAFRTEEKRVSEEHITITFGDVRHKFLATQLFQIVLCCVTILIKDVYFHSMCH